MKSVSSAFVVFCLLALSTFRLAGTPIRDFLTALGFTRDQAEYQVFQSIWSESPSLPTGGLIRGLVVGDRPGVAREVVEFARSYTASPAFKEKWDQTRAENRPKPPEGPKSGQEMLDLMRADLTEQIAEMEAQAAQSDPEIKAMLMETVEMLKEQLVALDDPDNPYLDPDLQQVMAQGAASEMAAHELALAEWEVAFPEDPRGRIASRLEKSLAMCSDVDFSATLVPGDGGKKLFADPAFEAKPYEWKACFRAGPEAVDAARAAIVEWLAELR